MEPCLAHEATSCREGVFPGFPPIRPLVPPARLHPQSSPHPRMPPDHAPSSEESTGEDKPSKAPPPNCSHWGPNHMSLAGVNVPRTRSMPSHCNAMQVSILAKRKKKSLFFLTESFHIAMFQKSVSLSTPVNFSQNTAACICHRRGVLTDTLTTFFITVCSRLSKFTALINMDNATSHILC